MPQSLAKPVADLIAALSRLPGIGPKDCLAPNVLPAA